MYLPRLTGIVSLVAFAAAALGATTSAREFELEDRATGTKYVFAHFIVSLRAF